MKFSIRDLMFVTVIVALAMGWWVDRAALKAKVEKLEGPTPQKFIEALRNHGKTNDATIAPPVVQHIEEFPIIDSFKSAPDASSASPNPRKP